MEQLLHEKFNFCGEYERPLYIVQKDDYVKSQHKALFHLTETTKKISKYLFHLHGWVAANPSFPSTVSRSRELYVDDLATVDAAVSSRHTIANWCEQLSVQNGVAPENRIYVIEERLIANLKKNDPEPSHMIVIGDHGIGKTTFFNYWLNHRTKALEESGVIWFRIDANKIYEMRLYQKNKLSKLKEGEDAKQYREGRLTLELYHKIHTIYVTVKYGDPALSISPCLSSAFDELLSLAGRDQQIDDFLTRVMEMVEASKTATRGANTEDFLRSALKYDKDSIFESVYEKCVEHWSTLGKKVVMIIDGVDNIKRDIDSIDIYNELMSEVADLFITKFTPPFMKQINQLILVARPETYADIKGYGKFAIFNTNAIESADILKIVPADLSAILDKKSIIGLAPSSHDFLKLKKEIDDCYQEEFADTFIPGVKNAPPLAMLDKFRRFSIDYLNKIGDGIIQNILRLREANNTIITQVDISSAGYKKVEPDIEAWKEKVKPSSLLKVLYNNNLRASIHNFLFNFDYINMLHKMGVLNADRSDRYMQYVLIHGNVYLNSPDDNRFGKGNVLPNIFWWDDKQDDINATEWRGLIGIRILQLLNSRYGKLNEKILRKLISFLFGASDSLLTFNIIRLIRYGLIEYHQEDHNSLLITQKGRFVLDHLFMDPFCMYYCALDTPLDAAIVIGDSRYIKMHSFPGLTQEWTRFNTAFIMTTIVFVRHILSQHSTDIDYINTNWPPKESHDNVDINIFKTYTTAQVVDIFALPEHIITNSIHCMKIMFHTLFEHYPQEAEDLLNELAGLYPEHISL